MTATETTDPVTAVVYGTLAYASLRPGVATAIDLVAGNPGPWQLADEAQAALAIELVARLRSGQAPAPADVLGQVVHAGVIDACQAAQEALFAYHGDHRAVLPTALVHQIEQMEQQLIEFIAAHPDGLNPPTTTAPPAAPTGEVPSIDVLMGYRHDQWVVLLQERGWSLAEAMNALRDRAVTAELVPPSTLRAALGRSGYVNLLADILATPGGPS